MFFTRLMGVSSKHFEIVCCTKLLVELIDWGLVPWNVYLFRDCPHEQSSIQLSLKLLKPFPLCSVVPVRLKRSAVSLTCSLPSAYWLRNQKDLQWQGTKHTALQEEGEKTQTKNAMAIATVAPTSLHLHRALMERFFPPWRVRIWFCFTTTVLFMTLPRDQRRQCRNLK